MTSDINMALRGPYNSTSTSVDGLEIYNKVTEPVLLFENSEDVSIRLERKTSSHAYVHNIHSGILDAQVKPTVLHLNSKITPEIIAKAFGTDEKNQLRKSREQKIEDSEPSYEEMLDKAEATAESNIFRVLDLYNPVKDRDLHITWDYANERVLKLAGLSPLKEESVEDLQLELLRYIADSFDSDMKIGVGQKYLELNGISTNISSRSIKTSYFGLLGLVGKDKAKELVGKIIKQRLSKVFKRKRESCD